MLSFLRKKFNRNTLKRNIHRYVSKKKDICCEEDIDRKKAIEHLFDVYSEMSGDDYLNEINHDFVKFVGYKEELVKQKDRQGLSLWNEIDKSTYENKSVNREAITKALREVPLYYLLSFLGYAYYRYKEDVVPMTQPTPVTNTEDLSHTLSNSPKPIPMSPKPNPITPRPTSNPSNRTPIKP